MKVAFLKKALPFVLFAALVLAIVLYPREAQTESAQPVVVSVWNVDTFEGGRGSRTSFLKRVAQRAESEQENVF